MVLSVPTAPVLEFHQTKYLKTLVLWKTLDMNSVPITVLLIKLI
jgi:hypothetical protein